MGFVFGIGIDWDKLDILLPYLLMSVELVMMCCGIGDENAFFGYFVFQIKTDKCKIRLYF